MGNLQWKDGVDLELLLPPPPLLLTLQLPVLPLLRLMLQLLAGVEVSLLGEAVV